MHEVIVVDDGSTDGTAEILEAFVCHDAALMILSTSQNMGKGYAVEKGIDKPAGRFVFYTDADLAYPIEGIEAFLRPLRAGTYKVAVGSRSHADSLFHFHPRRFRCIYRRHLMSRFFNRLVRSLLGFWEADSRCGFKGFRTAEAKAIFSQIRTWGFAFDAEVLLIAHRLGLGTIEIPGTYTYGGGRSTVNLLKNFSHVCLRKPSAEIRS